MPVTLRRQAAAVFTWLAKELKVYCMILQNYMRHWNPEIMNISSANYRNEQIESIKKIFQFFLDRIKECSCFIHVIDAALNKIFVDPRRMVKNDNHPACCPRYFPPEDIEESREYEEVFQCHADRALLCSCSPLDLALQTNLLIDNSTRAVISDVLFKLFQSYHFKRALTLSYAANYEKATKLTPHTKFEIARVGVQVLTSSEMSLMICKNKVLRDNMSDNYARCLKRFADDYNNLEVIEQLFVTLHDFSYMGRPECVKYLSQETDWIERLVEPIRQLYLLDTRAPRAEMVEYA